MGELIEGFGGGPGSYERPPSMDITLEEFETFAIARLKGMFLTFTTRHMRYHTER